MMWQIKKYLVLLAVLAVGTIGRSIESLLPYLKRATELTLWTTFWLSLGFLFWCFLLLCLVSYTLTLLRDWIDTLPQGVNTQMARKESNQ